MTHLEKLLALQHLSLTIQHNDHENVYETVERWLEENDNTDMFDVLPEDCEEMKRTRNVWTLQWYPHTPVGFCSVAAATLERCIDLACAAERGGE